MPGWRRPDFVEKEKVTIIFTFVKELKELHIWHRFQILFI